MAALTLKSIRLSSLALGAALALAPPALAADVSVKLDAGTGFSIKNSTGAIERLRVDEATGNVSRNGALFVHTTGTNNTFVGAGAGNTGTTGYGQQLGVRKLDALLSNTTGHHNSGVGSGRAALQHDRNLQLRLRSRCAPRQHHGSLQLRLRRLRPASQHHGFVQLRLRARSRSTATPRATGIPPSDGRLSPRTRRASYNSAVGQGALSTNTTGAANSAFGVSALLHNTTGFVQLRLRAGSALQQHHGLLQLRPSDRRPSP